MVNTFKDGIGSIGKLPDPWSPRFLDSLHSNLELLAEGHALSPWLLGVFIHNELEWKGGIEISEQIFRSQRPLEARRAAIEFLDRRYGGIENLNAAWGARFEGYEAIRPFPEGNEAYRQDLTDIMEMFAEEYFRFCRDAMRRFFPNHLYLGCRFNNFHPIVTRAASRFCDVISANVYRYTVDDFSMPTDERRPIIIGEFHFGIPDYGHWGRGLRSAADASNQADLLTLFLRDAVRHRDIVGAHWFAWCDQPVTGRGDGENFGIGLVSIVDRPHALLTQALSDITRKLHFLRLSR